MLTCRLNVVRDSLVSLVAAAVLVACSGGGGGGGGGGGDLAMGPGPYPAGPYGNQLGGTMAELSFAGYRLSPLQTDSTKLTWDTTMKLSDVRNNPAYKCLVLTIGARWCGACQQEQPALASDVMSDPSFAVLGILQEGFGTGVPATRADVDGWTQLFHQDFPVVQGTPASEQLFQGWGSMGVIGLPFSLIIKTPSMRVVDEVEGFDSGIHARALTACK